MELISFRALKEDEYDKAYSILLDAYDWLRKKGIKQWKEPMPERMYKKWHGRGENFGLFVSNKLAAVLSLPVGAPHSWSDFVSDDTSPWLYALATTKDFRNRGLGRLSVKKALMHLKEAGTVALYTTCVVGNEYLPSFYKELFFKEIVRETRDCGDFGALEYVLMSYVIKDLAY